MDPQSFSSSKRNSLSFVLDKTRRLVNDIVKPHPAFEIPPSELERPRRFSWTSSVASSVAGRSRSRSPAASRNQSYLSLVLSDASRRSWPGETYSVVSDTESRSRFSPERTRRRPVSMPPVMSEKTGLSQDNSFDIEADCDVESEIEFASFRSRKHKSLGDTEQYQTSTFHQTSAESRHEAQSSDSLALGRDPKLRKIKGQIQSGRRIRRKSVPMVDQSLLETKDSMSSNSQPSLASPQFGSFSTGDASSTILGSISSSVAPKVKVLTPIMEQMDQFGMPPSDSSSSNCVGPGAEAPDAIQVVDRSSGIVFGRVEKGSSGHVSHQDFGWTSLQSSRSLSLHIGSPPPAAIEDMHEHADALPSFVLTIPTPQPQHSPVFVPSSPFTVDKFVEATQPAAQSRLSAPITAHNSPIPLLPRCSHLGPDTPPDELCRTCEMQMLACKVWYQGNDGGRRRSLREPYIKPGESNASNRAMMEMLGLPAAPAQGLGLGLNSEEDCAVPDSPVDPDDSLLGNLSKTESRSGMSRFLRLGHYFPVRSDRRRDSITASSVFSKGKAVLGKLRHPQRFVPKRFSASPSPAPRARPTSFLALDSRDSASGFATKVKRPAPWHRRRHF